MVFSADTSLLRLCESEEYVFATVGDSPLSRSDADIAAVRSAIARLTYLLMPDRKTIDAFYHQTEGISARDQAVPFSFSDEDWYEANMLKYQILLCLSRHKRKNIKHSHLSKPFLHFAQCVDIIHKDYDQPLSAKTIAKRVGFSESAIYRLFQEHMGMSFTCYLNSIRISAACGLLETSRLNATEISEQCGFTSLSNFYRAFHQFTGYSPIEYRRQHQKGRKISAVIQKDLLMLNQFEPLWESSYHKDELRKFF